MKTRAKKDDAEYKKRLAELTPEQKRVHDQLTNMTSKQVYVRQQFVPRFYLLDNLLHDPLAPTPKKVKPAAAGAGAGVESKTPRRP